MSKNTLKVQRVTPAVKIRNTDGIRGKFFFGQWEKRKEVKVNEREEYMRRIEHRKVKKVEGNGVEGPVEM